MKKILAASLLLSGLLTIGASGIFRPETTGDDCPYLKSQATDCPYLETYKENKRQACPYQGQGQTQQGDKRI